MKKKLFLVIAIVAVLACLFAISVSAAEPNYDGEKVTLDDGTVCPLWDTDGNPLIWYVKATAEDGTKTYDYIDATLLYNAENRKTECVDYNCGYTDVTDGVRWYQVKTITITRADGSTYGNSTFVVVNMKSDKILTTSGKATGQPITAFTKMFGGNNKTYTLEYFYLPLCTVYLKGENFKNCNALKYVNLEELKELKDIGSQDFNGCPVLFDGQVLDLTGTNLKNIAQNGFSTVPAKEFIFPSSLTSINQCFASCSKLEKVTFNGDLTYINPGFNSCQKLVEVVGADFSIISGLGNNVFKECYVLKQVDGLIEDGVLTIPEGIKSVGTFTFNQCDAITAIVFPSTFNYIGQQGFSFMDNVKIVDFSAITEKLELNNCGHFRGLKNLVAVSLPEGIEQINNRAFVDCTNLTAVYMPNSVKYLNSNGAGSGSFCNSPKMYFVQEPFAVSQCITENGVDVSKLVLPEKPTVYYMPTSLEKFTGHTYTNDQWCNATMFKGCVSINDVLVFPESFVSMTTMRPFEGMGTADSPKTLVFTGDIQEFSISHQSKYITYVFANANDKSFEDLGIKRTTGNSNEKESYAYFCSTGKKYELAVAGRVSSGTDPSTAENTANIAACIAALKATETAETYHVHDKNQDMYCEATCENAAGDYQYCFCGAIFGFEQKGADALGHLYNDLRDQFYPENNYYANATCVYFCSQCNGDVTVEDEAGTKLFTAFGYSASEDDPSNVAFIVYANAENIKAYSEFKTISVAYGLVVSANTNGTPLTYADGSLTESANTVKINMTGTDYNKLTVRVSNIGSFALHCNGYVVVGEELFYLNHATVDTTAQTITYAGMLELLEETEDETEEEIPEETPAE